MDANEASCNLKGNRDQGSENFSRAFISLAKFSLYCEISLCFQSSVLFSICFLGHSVILLCCTEVGSWYLENTEQLFESFSLITPVLGCQMHSYREKKDDFVAEARHEEFSDMGSISCFYHLFLKLV